MSQGHYRVGELTFSVLSVLQVSMLLKKRTLKNRIRRVAEKRQRAQPK